MAEKEVEREIFTLNEISYFTESLSDEANHYIKNINIIEAEVQRIQLSLDIAKIAKDSFISKLEELVDEFEPVPEVA